MQSNTKTTNNCNNSSNKKSKYVIVIGICGVTCGGKTTLATKLKKLLPNSQVISQDNYFLNADDPRHIIIEELNHINFDILSSLDMEKMHRDIKFYIGKRTIIKKNTNNNIDINIDKNSIDIIVIEGFSIFNYKPLLDWFSLKYYLILNKDECYRRRSNRMYDPPDCPGYFEKCVWPEHLKQLDEVKKTIKEIKYFNEYIQNPIEIILKDLEKILKNNDLILPPNKTG